MDMAMRFRAHDTFFIRKGWLSKGMERIVAKPDLFVDKNENPMDILGIIKNNMKLLNIREILRGLIMLYRLKNTS